MSLPPESPSDDARPARPGAIRAGASTTPIGRVGSLLLWLLVAVQLAIPTSYYLFRAELDDERFAWRMFSAVRLRRCEIAVAEFSAGQRHEVDLARALHSSWLGAMRRGRQSVIEKFLRQRCAHVGIERVELTRDCVDLGARPLPEQRYGYECVLLRRSGSAWQ